MPTSRFRSRRLALGLLALGASMACGAGVSSAELPGERVRRLEAGDSLPRLTRPAGFAGTLPCADCPGLDTWLQLHPDGSYRLRQRVLKGDAAPVLRVGRWTLSRDSVPVLTLLGTPAAEDGPRRFAMTGALTLQALAADDTPAAPAGAEPPALTRVSLPADFNAPARIRGEFRYLADAATLVACDGGVQFPVAGDSAFVRLQRQYLETRLGTAAAILVDAVGHLALRAGGEEGTQVETFVVDSFAIVDRRSDCEATTVTARIAIGDWQLSALDESPVGTLTREVQPTLRFVLSEPTMFGNAGCNRFTGRAVLRGLTLVPQPLAVTKRLCMDETVMAREAAYTAALGAGGWFRLDGDALVLSQGGREAARFSRR